MKIITLIIGSGFMILSFQNCGFVERPQGTNESSSYAQSTHSNPRVLTMDCMTCHEDRRKSPDHYPGQDCKGCHTPGGTWSSQSRHNPTPTQCLSCHGPGKSYDKFPVAHFPIGNSDCIECHQASINTGFVNWVGGLMTHDNEIIVAKNCSSCHESDRPSIVTSTSVNPSINDGRVLDKSHFSGKDCYSCHLSNTVWKGTNVSRYEHSNASSENLQFCLSCHLSKEHVNSHGSVSNDIVGDGKCQQCHQRQRSWSHSTRNPSL